MVLTSRYLLDLLVYDEYNKTSTVDEYDVSVLQFIPEAAFQILFRF